MPTPLELAIASTALFHGLLVIFAVMAGIYLAIIGSRKQEEDENEEKKGLNRETEV